MQAGSPARVERRLVAILAADVAGYSRLMEQDKAGTLARLKELRRRLIDPEFADHKRVLSGPSPVPAAQLPPRDRRSRHFAQTGWLPRG